MKVEVNLTGRRYPIFIGNGLFEGDFPAFTSCLAGGGKVLAIMDRNVSKACFPAVDRCLRRSGIEVCRLILEGTEKDKSIESLIRCYEAMARSAMDRGSTVLSIGGGVVGDLAGFAASTFMRGIRLVCVPTTLLAGVDSSIGGKNGVNLPCGKNLIGTFHQPSAVFTDLDFIDTLPPRVFLDGMAEVIKYAVLDGPDFLEYLEEWRNEIIEKESGRLEEIVSRCCRFKVGIVEKDERDEGIRAYLNLGHTIGHALEAAGSYSHYSHGESISIGMRGAFLISSRLGMLDEADVLRLESILTGYGLPLSWNLGGVEPEDLWAYIEMDKKREGGDINFVLTKGFGSVIIRGVKGEKPIILKVLDDLRE